MGNRGSSTIGVLVIGFFLGIGGAIGSKVVHVMAEPVEPIHFCKMSTEEINQQSYVCVPRGLYNKDCKDCVSIVEQIENVNREKHSKFALGFLKFIFILTLLCITCRVLDFYIEKRSLREER